VELKLAIDPGLTGAICYKQEDKFKVIPLPQDFRALLNLLRDLNPDEIVLEDVSFAMNRRQANKKVLIESFYSCLFAAKAILIPVRLVTPVAWQKTLGIKKPKGIKSPQWKKELWGLAKERAESCPLFGADSLLIWLSEYDKDKAP
jgi:hypothetical protein